jgi:hypothetical protein
MLEHKIVIKTKKHDVEKLNQKEDNEKVKFLLYISMVSHNLLFHMKSTVVRASHYQCQSRNSPGFVPRIL